MLVSETSVKMSKGEAVPVDDIELYVETDISTLVIYQTQIDVVQGGAALTESKQRIFELRIPTRLLKERKLLR